MLLPLTRCNPVYFQAKRACRAPRDRDGDENGGTVLAARLAGVSSERSVAEWCREPAGRSWPGCAQESMPVAPPRWGGEHAGETCR
jgi:hypothetical protein